MLGSLGFSPAECGYRIISSGPHWRLRKYGQNEGEAPLLVVSAPIKRPYIWDLAPPISFVRFCLEHDFGVYLIEWLAPTGEGRQAGLADYADHISKCVAIVSGESQRV